MPNLPRVIFITQAYLNRLVREFEEAQPSQSRLGTEAAQPCRPSDAIVSSMVVPSARSADGHADAASGDDFVQPVTSSSDVAAQSVGAKDQQRPPGSAAGHSDPRHQPLVQGHQAATPCDVTVAPDTDAASEALRTDQLGMCAAPSHQCQNPPACSPGPMLVKRDNTAAVSESRPDAAKAASAVGAASLWASPVKPVKAAPEGHRGSAQAPAEAPVYPAELAPVTPEKHDTTAQRDADLPSPTAVAGRRRAVCPSQPVSTRRTSARGTAQTGRKACLAAEQGQQLPGQAGRSKHAHLVATRGAAAADIMPAAGRLPSLLGRKASAGAAGQEPPEDAEIDSSKGLEHVARPAPSETGEQSSARPVRVVANRELGRLLAAQPALDLSSLLTRGVSTRRQCSGDALDAGHSVCSSRQGAGTKASDRPKPDTASGRSKRWRDIQSVQLQAAPAQPSKRQRTRAAGLGAADSGTPVSVAARALRLRCKQADSPASVRSQYKTRQQRRGLMAEPLEHQAVTHLKSSARSADRPRAAQARAADVGAVAATGRGRTRSQAKVCDEDAAVPEPCLQTASLPSAPQPLSFRNAAGGRSSRRTAQLGIGPRSIAAIAGTSGGVQPQHGATGRSSRAGAACRAVTSGHMKAAHSPATPCEAEAAPPQCVAIGRELASLLRGSGSAGLNSGRRSDELPAGLALRNRRVMGRTTATAQPAAAQTAHQADGDTATVRAARISTVVLSPLQEDSTAATEHAASQHRPEKMLGDSVAADAVHAGIAAADARTPWPVMLDVGVASQQQIELPAAKPKPSKAQIMQHTGTLQPEPGEPAAAVSNDSRLPAGLGAATDAQPTVMLTESRQASTMQAKRPPLPLLPAPPQWGGRGRRGTDVAAAVATARGRALRAARPDYARLAASEAAATRLPVWPGPQVQVSIRT